tara:strand:- start:2 stop:889 length:888 start_codon:yes stop_codon:yes gene_type:complete
MSEAMTDGAVEESTATPEVSDAPAIEGSSVETTASSWTEGIEDEKVRNLAGRYTTPAAMANALYEANRELSQRVKMPGEDASDEDRAKFNKQMGVPESVDDYEIAPPEGIDAEAFASEEYQAPIKSIIADMHAAGASQGVVNAMLSKYFELEMAGAAERNRVDTEHMQKAEADLRKEWGASYDENVAFANDYLSRSPDLIKLELRDGSLLGSHPAFVRQMAEVGRMTNEGQLKFGISGTEMANDMQSQYDQLSRDIHDAYQKGDRKQAATLSVQRASLSERLHGNQSIVGAGRSI